MGQLLRLPSSRPSRRESLRAMPERLSRDELLRLFRLAQSWGFRLEHVYYATWSVRTWHDGQPSTRKREDWVMVILNSMRLGWGLRGFKAWLPRRPRPIFPTVEGPRDQDKLRFLTPEVVSKVMEILDGKP